MDKKENQYELLTRVKSGDEEAKALLVEENMGLVRSVAKRFFGRGHEAEDLLQIGVIGLIKAIEKFDTNFDVRFSTYAVPLIMGEIKRYIRDDGIIKVSRSLKELAYRIAAEREALRGETGDEPKICDIAQRMGVSSEEIAAAISATAQIESLYATIDDGSREGTALLDRIESPTDCEGEIVDRLLISSAIKELPKREQKIIMLRYYRQKTQSQIAELMGISQVQVSRIEKKVLQKMKEKLAD